MVCRERDTESRDSEGTPVFQSGHQLFRAGCPTYQVRPKNFGGRREALLSPTPGSLDPSPEVTLHQCRPPTPVLEDKANQEEQGRETGPRPGTTV